jgi:hypothetical protein
MVVINRETLILIGILVATGIIALVVALASPRGDGVAEVPTAPAAYSQTTSPSPATTSAQVATAATTTKPVSSTSSSPAATATTQPQAVSPQPALVSSLVQVVEPTESQPLPNPGGPPVIAVDGVIYAGEYAHSAEAGGFQIHWWNDASFLRVGVISPGTGYVAVGFDPDDRMQGANFVLAAVRDGQLWTRDDYGYGALAHAADVSLGGTDDILAAAGRETDGETHVEFVIALNSGDQMDKPLVPANTYDIVIAFHETSDDFDTYHSRRGAGKMRLDPG